MQINGAALREARLRQDLTIQELAERSKLSERQITRLENKTVSKGPRERTVKELAKALRVSMAVLAGTEPLPPIKPEEPRKVAVSNLISPSSRLALELVCRRYGVNAGEVLAIAPLLFAIAAEGSLAWRRQELEKLEASTDEVRTSGQVAHLAFANAVHRVEMAADAERRAIQAADLFGDNLDDDAYQFGYDPSQGSPFAHYLAKLAKGIDGAIVEISEVGGSYRGRYPDFDICEADLEKICEGSEWGLTVLRWGHARLADIPEELWSDDRRADRAAWLDAKMPAELAASLSKFNVEFRNVE